MNVFALTAITVAIIIETIKQLCFKAASFKRQDRLLWTSVGITLHVLQLVAWFFALTLMPLAIATPLMGATYVTIALASRYAFRERLSNLNWIGIVVIVAGVFAVSWA